MKNKTCAILLKNVNIVDGKLNSSIKFNQDILIENGKISKISDKIPFYGKTLDLSGKFVLPGLINMHAHLPSSGKVSKKKLNDNKKIVKVLLSNALFRKIGLLICKNSVQKSLYSGVTTVRAVGGIGNIDSVLRDKIESGKIEGSRLIVANTAIGVVGGHMDGTVAVGANSNEEAVLLAKKQIEEGADIIKLMITGGILDATERGKPGVLKMKSDMVKSVVDFAHKNNKIVAAHIEGPEGMKVAIENGVDTLEHTAEIDEEHLLSLKARGGAIICTLSPAVPIAYISPDLVGYGETAQYNTIVFMKSMISNIENCLKLGVKIGLGADTGCPYVTHYSFYRELIYFNKLIKNSSPQLAIHLATLANAEIAGISDKVGSVEEGKIADLLIVNENPLENLEVLGCPHLVLKEGKIYANKFKKFIEQDKVLDSVNL